LARNGGTPGAFISARLKARQIGAEAAAEAADDTGNSTSERQTRKGVREVFRRAIKSAVILHLLAHLFLINQSKPNYFLDMPPTLQSQTQIDFSRSLSKKSRTRPITNSNPDKFMHQRQSRSEWFLCFYFCVTELVREYSIILAVPDKC